MSQEFLSPQATPSSEGATAAEGYESASAPQAAAATIEPSPGVNLGQTVRDYVRQHPGEAMLISAAVGLVFALLALPGNSSTTPD